MPRIGAQGCGCARCRPLRVKRSEPGGMPRAKAATDGGRNAPSALHCAATRARQHPSSQACAAGEACSSARACGLEGKLHEVVQAAPSGAGCLLLPGRWRARAAALAAPPSSGTSAPHAHASETSAPVRNRHPLAQPRELACTTRGHMHPLRRYMRTQCRSGASMRWGMAVQLKNAPGGCCPTAAGHSAPAAARGPAAALTPCAQTRCCLTA
jgi:hypothetical protein